MEIDDRFREFAGRVRSLWPRYRTTDAELEVAVWAPRISKFPPDVVGQALSKHRSDNPDHEKPNWANVYRLLASRASIGGSELDVLIMQYRRDKDRAVRQRFVNATDAEVWQYFIEARIYPILFGCGGKFRQDLDRAKRMARTEVRNLVASWTARLAEAGADVPDWLGDVGIPDRWLTAMQAQIDKEMAK